jgi:hypothetical protein
MDPASHIGQRLRPMLQGWAGRLRAEYPGLTAGVCDLEGHGLALACVLPDVAPTLPGQVMLRVVLDEAHGALSVQSAQVVWGRPSGHIGGEILEAELRPVAAELTPERIEELADRLPELFAVLRQAIRRGRPPEM